MAEDPTTWTELKTSVRAWLVDIETGSVSDNQLEEFIALAERRFQREVFGPEREIVADLTLNAEEVSLPADLWSMIAIHISSTDPKVVLEPMTMAELRNSYSASTTGKPQNYAIRGEKLILGPAPDTSYTAKISYVQTIPALASGQATNWLLTDHPDLYIAATLAEAHDFLVDERQAAKYAAKRDALIAEISRSANRRTAGSAPIRIRPPGPVV